MSRTNRARGLVLLAMLMILAAAGIYSANKPAYTNVDTLVSITPSDKKAHKEFASDVFVGTVEAKVGEKARPVKMAPDTPKDMAGYEVASEQFEVTLSENIKGGLKKGETLVVDQEGGPTDSGVIELYEGTPRLDPGEEYIFLTRYDKERKTHSVIAQPSGIVPLNDDKAKKIAEYKGL